jgi:stage II sporulation protein M
MVPIMLSSSISVLTQSVFVILGIALIVQFESNGIFSRIVSAITTRNGTMLGSIFASPMVLYSLLGYFISATIISALIFVLASGFVFSAEYGSYWRASEGRPVVIADVMTLFREKWRKMAWTYFLSTITVVSPIIIGALLGLLVVYYNVSNPVGFFFILPSFFGLIIVGSIVTLFLSLSFIYSLVAVAAEDLSGTSAMARSFFLVKDNFGISFIYGIIYIIFTAVLAFVANLTVIIGAPITSLVSVIVSLLIIPVLHLTKTLIYRQIMNPSEMLEFEVYGSSPLRDLFGPFLRFAFGKVSRGMIELGRFIKYTGNIKYHIASAASFILGAALGSAIATNGVGGAIFSLGYTPGRINPQITTGIPLFFGFDIFLHNWQVSIATALAGTWLVVPSLVTLGFNGVILGVTFYLVPNLVMFLAAILPHGIIEIPSFVLAGSAGIKLGVAFTRLALSKGNSPEVVTNFHLVARQTVYVVIGLSILFLVAGFIEGNITPSVMRLAGWKG